MKRKRWTYVSTLGLVLALVGCADNNDPSLALGPDAERVSLVMYYSDGDWDWKSSGDFALIHTGESLRVQRRSIRPDASIVTSDWNKSFLPLNDGPPRPGVVEMLLDREHGVVCLAGRCGRLYAICPHGLNKAESKKCRSYNVE